MTIRSHPVDAWQAVDPLGEALHFLRMDGAFYCRSEFTAPWGLDLPAMPDCLMFHAITAGECWLEVADQPPRQLRAGDLALVPHGNGHRFVSSPGLPGVPLFDLPRELISPRYEVIRQGGGGAACSALCGAVRFNHPAAHLLVQLMPAMVVVEDADTPEMAWMHSTLRFMAAEAQTLRPGGETVITRLADILVIQALRAWIAHAPAAQTGWLGALQDRQIGRALSLMHRKPAHAWTLGALAAEAAMSRSAFAARFSELVGEPPMRYLARWRMHMALSQMQENDAPFAVLADTLGYQSEAAFNRAFKRHIGVSPGVARRGKLASTSRPELPA
ncbi:RCS-specific HTH-type transcriptional activator RclR [Andreprevotia sp. IGB-42]|uniref:AraC family transcriptional regulator n=1 Tax=Andreprevotia sp. IGB-42 TaxID=2497473 RepID=UPI00135B9659|nr:AraC family transcriptional regulator [Andreprevotia sp. IGB-42]KAF0813695.1 RCS-specific HTH-type transcriptional activator RclR [Andreprevotia sp. IGB-42]